LESDSLVLMLMPGLRRPSWRHFERSSVALTKEWPRRAYRGADSGESALRTERPTAQCWQLVAALAAAGRTGVDPRCSEAWHTEIWPPYQRRRAVKREAGEIGLMQIRRFRAR
jgi:hypothetical protein